jgi:hypothetical protein
MLVTLERRYVTRARKMERAHAGIIERDLGGRA